MESLYSYHYRVGKILMLHYGPLVKQLVGDIDRRDITVDQLAKEYEAFIKMGSECKTKKDKTKSDMEFILLAVLEYDGEALRSCQKTKAHLQIRTGLRPVLSEVLGFKDPTQVSRLLKTGRHYMEIYRSFDKEIDRKHSALYGKKVVTQKVS